MNPLVPVVVGIGPVAIDDVVRVARDSAPVMIADDALTVIAASRSRIEALADDPTPRPCVHGLVRSSQTT